MPIIESSRKVQYFGSSLAMTLPAMFVKACEIEKGTRLNVLYGLDGVLILSKCETADKIIESLNNLISKLNSANENIDNINDADIDGYNIA